MSGTNGRAKAAATRNGTRASFELPWYKTAVVTPSVPSGYLLTYEDWEHLPEHDGRLCELIDGELFVTPSPNIHHQRVSRDLGVLLLAYLRGSGKGELFFAPTGVRLGKDSVLEPDLVVVLREHAGRIGTQLIDGPPDLVVEVLSPGTARRDLGPKREKYRSAGVSEYWMVDAINASVEVLVLENGDYVSFGVFTPNDKLRSRVLPDFEVVLADVFSGL